MTDSQGSGSLFASLRRWGKHDDDCLTGKYGNEWSNECSCGLSEALRIARSEQPSFTERSVMSDPQPDAVDVAGDEKYPTGPPWRDRAGNMLIKTDEAALAGSESPAPRDEMVCDRCHRRHGVVWFAYDEIWNAVMREGDRGKPDEYSFCCPTCFMQLATERGVASRFAVTEGIPDTARDAGLGR